MSKQVNKLEESERIKNVLYGWVSVEPESSFEGLTKEQILEWIKNQSTQDSVMSDEEDELIYQHCLTILHDYGYDKWFKTHVAK